MIWFFVHRMHNNMGCTFVSACFWSLGCERQRLHAARKRTMDEENMCLHMPKILHATFPLEYTHIDICILKVCFTLGCVPLLKQMDSASLSAKESRSAMASHAVSSAGHGMRDHPTEHHDL